MMKARSPAAHIRATYIALLCSVAAGLTTAPASARTPAPRRLSRADEAYLRRETAMLGVGPMAPVSTDTRTRSPRPSSSPSHPVSAATSAVTASGDTTARREAALHGLERSGAVRRCWSAHLLRFPTALSRRLPLTLHVDTNGRVTSIDVRDGDAPELAECIARAGVSVTPVGPGEPLLAETTLTLDRGE